MTATPEQKKPRRIYWLCDAVQEKHREIGLSLESMSYGVMFFSKWDNLQAEIQKQRPAIIIVGDELAPNFLEKAIIDLASSPELQGVRLILSVSSQKSDQVAFLAASANFRDMIPMDLAIRSWLERFVFATSRTPMNITEAMPQIAVNQLASISLPARLVWISDRRILFEARVKPNIGSNFALAGKFVEALGLKRITIAVEECRRTDLIFRFSDAVVARWNVPETHREIAKQLISKLRQSDFGPRIKVFIAMQDAAMRNLFLKELDPLRFEVNVALQKQSIIDEPQYFSPQIVFIEDRLCMGIDADRVKQMLDLLPPDVPVYVMGNRAQIKPIQDAFPNRRISMITKIPEKLTEAILTRYLPPNARKSVNADEGAVHIGPDHPFSRLEVQVPARLTRIHPTQAQLSVPVTLGSFGLIKIEAPELKKTIGFAPMAKIVKCYENYRRDASSFPFAIDTYLADVGKSHQKLIAAQLSAMVAQSFNAATASMIGVVATKVATSATKIAVGSDVKVSATLAPGYDSSKFLPEYKEPITPENLPVKYQVAEQSNVGETIADTLEKITDFLFHKDTKLIVGSILLIAAFIWATYFVAITIAPYYHKSGGQYTDSLRKFAPDRFIHENDQESP